MSTHLKEYLYLSKTNSTHLKKYLSNQVSTHLKEYSHSHLYLGTCTKNKYSCWQVWVEYEFPYWTSTRTHKFNLLTSLAWTQNPNNNITKTKHLTAGVIGLSKVHDPKHNNNTNAIWIRAAPEDGSNIWGLEEHTYPAKWDYLSKQSSGISSTTLYQSV